MLIIVAIEVRIQNLIKEVRETKELEEGAASKGSASPTDSNGSPSLLPRSSGSKGQFSSIREPALPNKESESAKEPQAGGLVSNTEGAKEEAKGDHTFLSSDQENRVK
jgi:hypothetical protein